MIEPGDIIGCDSVPGAYGGGYDGVVEVGMTLCIESYAGERWAAPTA